jgi:membrane-associated phospholipid phosphatase
VTTPARARRESNRADLARVLGADRLSIFVPAVMSVGLLFWIVNEVRDLLHDRRVATRDKRAALAARSMGERLPGEPVPPASTPERTGLRPRPVYALLGVALVAVAVYVAVGATGNYVRERGYLSDIAWLLAASWGVVVVAALYGLAALATWWTYPEPGALFRRLVRSSALTVAPGEPGVATGRPSWRVTAGLAAAMASFALLAMIVGWSPHVIRNLDDDLARFLGDLPFEDYTAKLDPVGSTPVAIAVALIVALGAFRCRVLAIGYVLATATGLLMSLTIRPLVARPRPDAGPFAGQLDSFPSGHVLLATVMAGLLPVAAAVITGRRWVVGPLRVLLAVGVLADGVQRVSDGYHWPSDVVGGILGGLVLVLSVQWVLDTERSHARCQSCPWSVGHQPASHGLVDLHLGTAATVRLVAHLAAAVAAIGLAVLTLTVDVPSNPDLTSFGTAVQRPVQLGLAGLVSLGALVSWRWPAVGAAMIALAGTGLGLFASVEYQPLLALGMTAALLVPSVLLWLSWQHTRTQRQITALAAVTALLLAGTWVGATAVYDVYFGPTHPESTTPSVPADRVEWLWMGGLTSTSVTVTARLEAGRDAATAVVRDTEGVERARRGPVAVGEHRIVRVTVDGLVPDTAYRIVLEVDGHEDAGRGVGTFRTPGTGPYSFRFAFASCARSGSNGAVYDAIRAVDPLLFIEDGDLHYGNIEATDPGAFLRAYDQVLTEPAQAALARSVPMAYVWDDHDYGPNDADATSPGRSAVRAAYRLAVPHYGVTPGDAPINQAFTIGRVRFVMTDGRSERTGDTMLGAVQQAWLVDEIVRSSATHALVVWVNPTPWIGPATSGSDTWAGYAAERTEIADALAAAGVRNLLIVSGDAHMLAADDGTNSDYSTDRVGGFPVLQAAALDRPGSTKGGPYSEGTHPGAGQFGVVDVADDGESVTVTFTGRRWDGDVLLRFTTTF